MEILPRQPSTKGPAQMFTGDVWFDVVARGEAPSRVRVNTVRFAPGARTAWPSHSLGQTLHVTDGVGRVQSRACEVLVVRPGDVIYTPPDAHVPLHRCRIPRVIRPRTTWTDLGRERTGLADLRRGREHDRPTQGRMDMGNDVDVLTETVIRRPVAEVAAYAGDPSNAPEWYANISSVEWQTPPPVAVGSRLDFVATFLGRRLAYTYEVTELVPGERLVMRTAQGPFPMETTYTWQPLDPASTRMTLRNRGRPAGFSRLVAPFMALAVRRANHADLARLRALLERS